jgi:hypothetical protein
MSESKFRLIQAGINDRQNELHRVADILARAAQHAGRRASWGKVVLIFLGAFAATKGAADQIAGKDSLATIVIYTVAGLLIATIAGLEAAFKLDSRSTELKLLAADCQSTLRKIDSQWQKEIGTSEDTGERIAAARRLLDAQDAKLEDIQVRAARLQINVTQEVRELDSVEIPTPPSRPYSA